MTRRLRPLLPFLLASPLLAQTGRTPQPEDFGTVTGHVTCSDTQRPARLASVRLVPANTPAASRGELSVGTDDLHAQGGNLNPVQTDMSGAFRIRNVRPGLYYLRVDYPGYITPLLSFKQSQLTKPDIETKQRIDSQLQIVSVAPRATTQAESAISRGASISGTVTYDDGSPAIGLQVSLLRRNAKGEFTDEYQPAQYNPPTDDHGHYRLDALPAGDYVVRADLSMREESTTSMPNPMGSGQMMLTMSKFLFALPVYSGSVLRRREAALVQAAAGQEIADTNLSIPLAKLHSVSGSLLAADGHTINGGNVKLLYADDHKEQLAAIDVDREDKQFHFPYVPEDDYILSVPSARDITQLEVENAKGFTPRTHLEDKTVRTYGAAEQPLKVQTDMTGVVVNVSDKKDNASPGTN